MCRRRLTSHSYSLQQRAELQFTFACKAIPEKNMMGSRKVRNAALGFFPALVLILAPHAARAADGETAPARAPNQTVAEAYTAKIQKYTTAPDFTSPPVIHLPAPNNSPTPH